MSAQFRYRQTCQTFLTLSYLVLATALSTPVFSAQKPRGGAEKGNDSSPGGSPEKGDSIGPEPYSGYRIGPEDVLSIDVWDNEALSVEVPVRPDGMISLPLLDDVQAAGLTPLELRDFLTKRLTEYMSSAEVSVIVTEVRSYKVSVLGAVRTPGRFELNSRSTILEVLAMAGGFTEFAMRSRIVVLRSEGDTSARIPFDYDKVLSDGDKRQDANFYLHPGDVVLVP